MSQAVIFFNEKKIFVFDKESGSELIEPFKIDSFNRFIGERLLDVIKSDVINKGSDIHAVLTDSSDGILVPKDLYQADKREDFYRLNYAQIDIGKVLVEAELPGLGATMIYSCKKWFQDFVNEHFGPIPVSNSTAEYLKKVVSEKDPREMHLILKEGSFDLIQLKDKSLSSFNVMKYGSLIDVLYYVVAHLDKCKNQTIRIQVVGDESQTAELGNLKTKIGTLQKVDMLFTPRADFFQSIL